MVTKMHETHICVNDNFYFFYLCIFFNIDSKKKILEFLSHKILNRESYLTSSCFTATLQMCINLE